MSALAFFFLPLAAIAMDVSTSQVEALPKAPTEIQVHTGKFGKPTVGDVIELTIKPPTEDLAAEPAIAEKLKAEPVEWGAGRIIWWKASEPQSGEIKLGLTTYKTGTYEIAPVPFIKDGKPVFASQPKTVQVEAVGGDKAKDEIYPPQSVGFPQWVWIVLGLFTLALVLGGLWWLKKWSEKRKGALEELARAPRVFTPLEEFEKTRAETEQKKLVESAKFKPHYFALSDASKRFFGRSFRFDAEERTTRELIRELEGLGLSNELVAKWEKIFDEMDVTKFTDQTPESNAALSLSARLSQLVAATYRLSPVAREAIAVMTPEAKR